MRKTTLFTVLPERRVGRRSARCDSPGLPSRIPSAGRGGRKYDLSPTLRIELERRHVCL